MEQNGGLSQEDYASIVIWESQIVEEIIIIQVRVINLTSNRNGHNVYNREH